MPSLRKTHVCTTLPCTYCRGERLAHMKNAQGLCSNLTCGEYLDINSSTFCTGHLEQSKHTNKQRYHGSQNEQLPTRNYLSSFRGNSPTGTTTSIRSSRSSMRTSSYGGSTLNALSYTPSQESHIHSPYQINRAMSGVSAAEQRHDGIWDNTLDEQLTASASQAYSSYGAPPSLVMGHDYGPSEPGLQGFNNGAAYQSLDGYGYGQSHVGSSHYTRPLPTATPSGQSGQYEYQPWTWDSYHRNHPIQDPDSYY